MAKNLLLVGGGHAHMVTLAKLHTFVEKGYQVTVVGPSAHHYYSGMGPGMLGKTYAPDDIRFRTKHVVEKQGGTFVLDSVTKVDPVAKTATLNSGNTLPYDVLSFNAGSYVPPDIIKEGSDDSIFFVKPIEKLIEAQNRITALTADGSISIGIVGGGPSAAEVAGNIWQLVRNSNGRQPRMIIFSGQKFMSRFPDKVQQKAFEILSARGVEILEGDYVEEIYSNTLKLQSGKKYELDIIFMALGTKPSPIFERSGLPIGPDGGLLVNKYLQSPEYPDIFGGGDCIYFQDEPLDKVGVFAVRENPILYHNLMAALDGDDLQAFDPGGKYLLIFNMGAGIGILHKSWLHLSGRVAFWVKDYIDRKFIKTFQAIE